MSNRVLVVDDDNKLRSLLTEYLAGYGYEVSTLSDGNNVIETIDEKEPDIMVLDIMMPGRDGLEVLGEVRRHCAVPVIMLTAKGEDADRIVGLELGADDYLPKPFNPRELLARMKAVLRRSPAARALVNEKDQGDLLKAAGLALSRGKRALVFGKEAIELSATEYKIMAAMIKRPEVVFTREQLMNLSRGREATPFDRSIDVHISKLRSKIKPYTGGRDIIKTVWGVGYMLAEG